MPEIILKVNLGPQHDIAPNTPVSLCEIPLMVGRDLEATVVARSYVAVLTQGGGCDYTIGCGVKVKALRATSLEAARDEVVSLIENDYGTGIEQRIEGVTLYETTAKSPIDIQAVYAQIAAKQKAEEEEEEEERAEFERVSKKYGRP